jgi:hypothetical protein
MKMPEKISSEYTISPVSNGFILRPLNEGEYGRMWGNDKMFVFETVVALATFIQENFTDLSKGLPL